MDMIRNERKNIFLQNSKGVSIVELTFVIILLGVIAMGFFATGKDTVDLAYEQEGYALIEDIASKERLFYTRRNRYADINVSTSNVVLGNEPSGIVVDARRNQYYRTFTAVSKRQAVNDALGSPRELDVLEIKVFGSGPALGKDIEAEYNKWRDELTIKK
jgi:Tfp pilus assembly protein PilE